MAEPASKTCLITGANGGIGSELVRVFSAAGYSVIASDHAAAAANLPCESYQALDLNQFVDDSDYAEQSIKALLTALNGRGLDVLINNAALQILGGIDSLQIDDWRSTFNVNVFAPFLLTQKLLTELERANGCVINIGSIHARLTKKHFVAYATSKSALEGLTRSLAVDMGERVRVNAISPAAIDTPMLRDGFKDDPAALQKLAAYHPSNSIGAASEVGEVALLLASKSSPFLNGSIVQLDGGIGSRLHDPG